MHYRAVVDQFGVIPVLDPLAAAIFVSAFVATALLTVRRASYGLCALVVAAPFAFEHAVAGTTVTFAKVVLLGVLAGLGAHGGWAALRDRAVTPLMIAAACYAGAIALSLNAAAFPGPAARETLKAIEYLAFLVAGYLCHRFDPDDAPVVWSIAATSVVVCFTALAQEVTGAPSGLCVGNVVVPRIAGVLEGPNQLAGYLETSIAVLAAWSALRPSRRLNAALVIAAITIVLTYSRAGIGAVVIAGAAIAFIYRGAAMRALRWLAAGLVAGAAVAIGWAASLHQAGLLRVGFLESDCAGGVGNRTELYSAAVRLWLAHPFLGVGAGNFELEISETGIYGVRTHANSWYLQSLVEGGIPLAAATLALVAVALTTFARRLRDGSPWVAAAFAATLALTLHQIVDYLFFYPKVAEPWFVLLGIGAAALCVQRDSA